MNECKVQNLIFNFKVLYTNKENDVGITVLYTCPFCKGQLATLFHGQVCVISSLLHLQSK